MKRKRVIIIGAAGRDFHIFNTLFRNASEYEVVAFTASQIPFISKRTYPAELAGRYYRRGIQIIDESLLEATIKRYNADICVQAYSDISYRDVMHKSSIANANGADFWLIAPERSMLTAKKPVIGVCATRTGSGKSQTTRYIANILKQRKMRVGIIRHPMPYGHLDKQIVERFRELTDLERYNCTVEEREEYEAHIRNGFTVYAGVDYQKILRLAERESDIIIWDGGNNDAPFVRTDLLVVVVDPFRNESITDYYPSETVTRMADVLLINKVNSAPKRMVVQTAKVLRSVNKRARIMYADSVVSARPPDAIRSKSVLIVEDGPTITHGGMIIGAGTVAAKKYHAKSIVRAKQYAVGSIKGVFEKYRQLSRELPAMGYSKQQIRDLQQTINNAKCDVVISATPIDLGRIMKINKPMVVVSYALVPHGRRFDALIKNFAK